ncbi:MAG TPA: alpha/beta hydrolase family protein [Gemmataceae bacterium]
MKHPTSIALVLLVLTAASVRPAESDPARVLPPGEKPADSRLGKVRTLNDKDFFLRVPATKEAWQARRRDVREQMLVAAGLWPMPVKTPLRPVIHGKIDRDAYTIEKVFFASYPGHYVSGNLYRPKGKSGKLPGVLCPHGHWANGRFYEANDKTVSDQIKQGAEKTPEGARYPLQARCAQLARMGCVVFHYDMVGNADSTAIAHRAGFTDADAELHLQSFLGLQTWNSIRALDFLLSLPDVDARRIGVTGASGGGTQTFMLCALDDRPAVAFPAVMVSTAMQGGCVCENCSYLRIGTGNVEFAGLFAPKPLGMTGADDWTIDIERKGLPELKTLYRLHGAEDDVIAKCLPQFKHNYNQVSREVMYNWFNKHLKLGLSEPVVEKPFEPVPPKELSVYDETHPRPADSVGAERLRQYLSEQSDKQIEALRPQDAAGLAEYRRVFGTALRVMMHDRLPSAEDVEEVRVGEMEKQDGYSSRRFFLTRKGQNERIPTIGLLPPDFDGTVVVWIHPRGKASLFQDGKLVPAAKQVLDRKGAILAVDVFGTGELSLDKPLAVNPQYAGFTFGYNRTLLAQRVHDILTATAFAKGHEKTKTVHLIGFEKAGPWVLLARGLCGGAVARTAADVNGFRFENVRTTTDEMMQPGGLKYGGLPALAALAAPGELYDHNHQGTGFGHWLRAVYQAAGALEKRQGPAEKVADEKVVEWLMR